MMRVIIHFERVYPRPRHENEQHIKKIGISNHIKERKQIIKVKHKEKITTNEYNAKYYLICKF
jgi:hypothetical protein